MDRKQVQEILSLLGVQRGFWTRNDLEFVGECPSYLWDETARPHTHACFTISLVGGPSMPRYSCACCGSEGSLLDLILAVQATTERAFTKALNLLVQASTPRRIPRRVRLITRNKRDRAQVLDTKTPMPSRDILSTFPLLQQGSATEAEKVARWLYYDLGITAKVMSRAKLRLYVDPMTDELGVLVPVVDRWTKEVTELWACLMGNPAPRKLITDGQGFLADRRSNFALYGLERLTDHGFAFLVQNPLGALRCESIGILNVVAVMGEGAPDMTAISRVNRIYLALNDGARGCKMTLKILDRMPEVNACLVRWGGVKGRAGKALRGSLDLESVDQFKEVFERRISLSRQYVA